MTNISVPGDLTDFHICRQLSACLQAKGKKKKKKDLEETGHRQNISKKSDMDAAKRVVKTLCGFVGDSFNLAKLI